MIEQAQHSLAEAVLCSALDKSLKPVALHLALKSDVEGRVGVGEAFTSLGQWHTRPATARIQRRIDALIGLGVLVAVGDLYAFDLAALPQRSRVVSDAAREGRPREIVPL